MRLGEDPFDLVLLDLRFGDESELFGHLRGAFTGAVKDKGGKVHAADGGTLFLIVGMAPGARPDGAPFPLPILPLAI